MAVEFDGATESLSCGSDASIDNIFAGGGSIAAWIYLDSFGELSFGRIYHKTQTVFSVRDDGLGGDEDSCLRLFRGFATNGAWTSGGSTITTGVWTHVAVVYNSDNVNNNPLFYVDGVAKTAVETSTPAGARDTDAGDDLYIANNAATTVSFDGKIEDLRAANVEWTAEQIASLAAGYRGPLGGEALWLSMGDARGLTGGFDGASLANGTNYLPDLSANSNDGDPINTPIGRASKAPRYSSMPLSIITLGIAQAISGVLSFAGTLQTSTLWKRLQSGALALSSTLGAKSLRKRTLSGLLQFAGAINGIRRQFQSIVGILYFSSRLQWNVFYDRVLSGTLTFSSLLIGKIPKFVVATIRLCLRPIAIVRTWLNPDADVDIV